MFSGGMDGFDWLQSFLPADSRPDPDSEIDAYQTNAALHGAEEVARATIIHPQVQRSHSFMRSTNPGTNHALNPSEACPQASDGQCGGNKNQETSQIQFNHPPSSHSPHQTDPSHITMHRLDPHIPSQQHMTQAHRDAHSPGQACTGVDPAPYSWRTFNSMPNSSEPCESSHRVYETTRPTVPAQRTNEPKARAVPTSQNSYHGHSATPNQNSQMLAQPHVAQGMATQVHRTRMSAETQSPSHCDITIPSYNTQRPHSTLAQGTRPTPLIQRKHSPAARPQRPYQNHHAIPARNVQQLFDSAAAQQPWPVPPVQTTRTPVAKPQVSQSPSQSHSTSSTQNVLRPSHPNSPPSTQSWTENEICASLVSPKGFKTSAARSKLPQNVITPVTGTREASDFARSNPSLLGSSLHNQHNVPPAVPTAPDKVHSTAISQLVSPRSPSISLASSAPVSASTPPGPPRQTTIVPRQLDKCWSREKVGNQGKAAPDTSYEASNQKGQQPPISQPNGWHSTPVAASAFASLNSAASTSGPAYNSSSNSGPRRGTFSDSPAAQPPVGGNTPSRGYHLPEQLCHQKKRWVPAAEHSDDYSPPIKSLRLDNGRSQMMTHQTYPSTVTSVPGSQVPLDYARHRGPGKILKNRDDLVQPIRRSDALPKQSYDPATIARDVLIAAGRHPTEKHLNHHLEALRRNFTKIDYNADLATFRWDLVDTKQPGTQADRMPPVPASHIPHPQPPHPQPPQAAAWQSLSCDPTFTNSHVASRHHASTPARDTPPNRQVAMPERIDARVPLGGLSPWGTLPFQPPTYHTPQQSLFSNLPSGLPRIDPLSASPKFSSHQSVPFSTPPPAQPQPESQRRRPSTTKSVASPKPSPAKKQTPKFIVKPKPQGQAVKSQLNSGRAVKSPEARRLQPQVVITLSPAKMPTKKRPGRPPKNPANNIEVAIHREQQVQYQVFPCKWEGCAAELHNIDSVKAHLIKVHIPHSLVCKWIDCGNKTPMAAADMFTHLVSEHVSKMAWALGDGPTVPVTAGNKTNHPSVLGDCSARKGTMVLPVDEHQVKAFSKAHGKSTEKTKAQALLEAGRHWKQQVGPEMDWSDRRLSTPVRQSRVHCGEMAFVGEN